MANSPLFPIEVRRIRTIKVMHHPINVSPSRFKNQMIMIRHQHVTVKLHTIDMQRLGEQLEKLTPVGVVLEYDLPFVSSAGDVVDGARVLDSQWSGHGRLYRTSSSLSIMKI